MKIVVRAHGGYADAVVEREFSADKDSFIDLLDDGSLAVHGKKKNAIFARGEWLSVTRDTA